MQLEQDFDELRARHSEAPGDNSARSAHPSMGSPIHRRLLGVKKLATDAVIFLRSGQSFCLRPRSVGIDFVSGEVVGGRKDAVIRLSSIVAVESVTCVDTTEGRVAAGFSQVLSQWALRGQPVGLSVAGHRLEGVIGHADSDVCELESTRLGVKARLLIAIDSIDWLHSVTERED